MVWHGQTEVCTNTANMLNEWSIYKALYCVLLYTQGEKKTQVLVTVRKVKSRAAECNVF